MSHVPDRLASALQDRYRLERVLGEGGMATVYLAQDLRHGRQVAVKVLHPELSAVLGTERFLSEIRTTAALQHPHILPLFDSGSADGLLFYVMPMIEGETLRARLDREKQLPVADAIRLASEVAGALDYAHRHGVIHRDIKPENVLLHDGRALVADFGIALAVQSAGGQRMTQTGLSLGTPQYMSPEQAMGEREISARSDLYALGVITYEMLTGEPPFTGPTTQAIVARIMTEEPRSIVSQRKSVPDHVEAAVLQSLEKLPADRPASAAEFATALAEGRTGALAQGRTGASAARRSRSAATPWRLSALLGALLLTAALAAWGWLRPSGPSAAPVTRYTVRLPRSNSADFGTRVALSPDGSRLVFIGPGKTESMLWQRRRDQLEASPIPGTEGASNPFFSPEGTRLAFVTNTGLKVTGLDDGRPTDLASRDVGLAGGAWGADGYIYVDGLGATVLRVPESGGEAKVIVPIDSSLGETELNMPEPLPNRRGVLFTAHRAAASSSWMIGVMDLKTGRHRHLLPGLAARYVKSGHLLVVTADGDLTAVPFDQDRLEVTGTAVVLGRDVHLDGWQVNFAAEGNSLAYVTDAGVRDSVELVWQDANGTQVPLMSGWVDNFEEMTLSPDGSAVAVTVRNGSRSDIWVRRFGDQTLTRLTMAGARNLRPTWSSDGRTVYYTRFGGKSVELVARPADASRGDTVLAEARAYVGGGVTAPNGGGVMFSRSADGMGDIVRLPPGGGDPVPVIATVADEFNGRFSPDGRWLAYGSTEAGTAQVFVRPYPNTAETAWQISTDGAENPKWAPDGRTLYYQTSDKRIVATEILPGATFRVGRQRTVATISEDLADSWGWDVGRNGRLLMRRRIRPAPDWHIVVVENFARELAGKSEKPK